MNWLIAIILWIQHYQLIKDVTQNKRCNHKLLTTKEFTWVDSNWSNPCNCRWYYWLSSWQNIIQQQLPALKLVKVWLPAIPTLWINLQKYWIYKLPQRTHSITHSLIQAKLMEMSFKTCDSHPKHYIKLLNLYDSMYVLRCV